MIMYTSLLFIYFFVYVPRDFYRLNYCKYYSTKNILFLLSNTPKLFKDLNLVILNQIVIPLINI